MPIPLPNPAVSSARTPLPGADLLEVFQTAVSGAFPGAALEALIARLEGAK